MMTFGKRLTRLREEKHWSIQELAERSGVPYTTIYKCERGTHQEPRVSMAAKLARALGVPLDVLADTYGKESRDLIGVAEDTDSEYMAAVEALV
jgi:transcriptional regulator with XRE-family HTH domain